jgi:hypothetical protein
MSTHDPDRFRLRGALSPAQRTVLALGLLTGVVVGGCPPWLEVRTQVPAANAEHLRPVTTSGASVYAPVFRPPQERMVDEDPDRREERLTYRIDWPRLLAQSAALACLTGFLFLAAGRGRRGQR